MWLGIGISINEMDMKWKMINKINSIVAYSFNEKNYDQLQYGLLMEYQWNIGKSRNQMAILTDGEIIALNGVVFPASHV